MATESFDIVIVGAGFAGAATAYHLSERFSGSVAILEQEKTPGEHASGRNASLLRQSETDPAIRAAAIASRQAYERLSGEIGYEPVGSVLLGSGASLELARVEGAEAGGESAASRFVIPERVVERIPLLAGHEVEAALETPDDGVIDTWALLTLYLEGARSRGVELLTECRVEAVDRLGGSAAGAQADLAGGGGYRLRTSRGTIETGRLVDAAGAWAGPLAKLAGVEGPELVPYKRHLFVLDVDARIDTGWPFVWDLDHGFYFRPESGGLLFSICDEERAAGSLEESVTPGIEETLADTIYARLPALEDARVRRVWSCFRTRASDGRFVIGAAPGDERFVWVAGLGGHGMGCSWEIGRLAAQALLTGHAPAAFAPERF